MDPHFASSAIFKNLTGAPAMESGYTGVYSTSAGLTFVDSVSSRNIISSEYTGGTAFPGSVTSTYQRYGSGTPEGSVTAPVGAVYHRTDGGASTSFYVKESGTGDTGWVAQGSGGGAWGDLTGTLSDQTDLQAALDGKADALGADENYVTDAEKVVIGNTSGTNTGDQDLSGLQPLDDQLTDLASLSYATNALKVVRVNAGETAFELAAPAGGGDALVASTLDQFADVTQTGGATLAISASTTLSGGTHSGTNTGDQDLSGYVLTAAIDTLTELNAIVADATLIDTNDARLSDARAPTAHSHEGTAILSTGETGGTKFLREDGDGTSSWQTISGGGDAFVASNLDQFADVTQTTGKTLAISDNTTLSGGAHSGTNTGDNAVNSLYSGLVSNATHTGDVTGDTALTIANDAVTFAKMQNISTDHLIGRHSSGSGDPQQIGLSGSIELSGANLRRAALTGDVTAPAGDNSTTIANGVVTEAKCNSSINASLDLADSSIQPGNAALTDERVPTAAGLTSKFGTNKATIVDGDKIAILDSAATDAPKHSLFSLIKSTLKTYFDTLYAAALGADDNYVTDAEKAALHAAATVTGNGISLTGQQISLDIGTGSTQVAAGNHGHSVTGILGITIDGAGSAVTTGTKGYLYVPYACAITIAELAADVSGSIVIDVWKDTAANFPPTDADSITASAPPTLSSAQRSSDSTLTGWTVSLAAGDYLGFNVDSASTVTRVTLALKVTRTI
jgi:hypothetical protein